MATRPGSSAPDRHRNGLGKGRGKLRPFLFADTTSPKFRHAELVSASMPQRSPAKAAPVVSHTKTRRGPLGPIGPFLLRRCDHRKVGKKSRFAVSATSLCLCVRIDRKSVVEGKSVSVRVDLGG